MHLASVFVAVAGPGTCSLAESHREKYSNQNKTTLLLQLVSCLAASACDLRFRLRLARELLNHRVLPQLCQITCCASLLLESGTVLTTGSANAG